MDPSAQPPRSLGPPVLPLPCGQRHSSPERILRIEAIQSGVSGHSGEIAQPLSEFLKVNLFGGLELRRFEVLWRGLANPESVPPARLVEHGVEVAALDTPRLHVSGSRPGIRFDFQVRPAEDEERLWLLVHPTSLHGQKPESD